jgi:hypothetical protein
MYTERVTTLSGGDNVVQPDLIKAASTSQYYDPMMS